MPNKRLQDKISSQFMTNLTIRAKRGDIYDRHGELLATSVSTWSAFIDPKLVTQKDRAVDAIHSVLNIKRSKIYRDLSKKTRFVWVKRKLEQSDYQKLIQYDIKGLGFVEEYKRVYFNEASLSHVIGRVNIDGKGISGLEYEYDKLLSGQPVKIKTLKDAKGRLLIFSNDQVLSELKGQDLHLAIDTESQVFLAHNLKKQLDQIEAKRAWGAVVDVKTGEVIASAQVAPTSKNIMISEVQEPGSVLKTFSFLKAMTKLNLTPADEFLCGDDGFRIGRRLIRNSHKEDCEKTTLINAFSRSLNTVSAELALKVGEKDLLKFYKKFGFDKKTQIDFPGEAHPLFHNKLSSQHHLASISFGHGISLNGANLLKAYVAIANGGFLTDLSYKKKNHTKLKRVISDKESFFAKGLMAGVTTDEGSGAKASVEGYLIGGKTGTSQKPDLENGGYKKEVLSTFIGAFPLSKPKYVAYVVMDEPQKVRSGGSAAAPVFSEIAKFILHKEQIFPDKINTENLRSLNTTTESHKINALAISEDVNSGNVPNLKGLSLREALKVTKDSGITINFIGSGLVEKISPAPGKALPENNTIQVVLK